MFSDFMNYLTFGKRITAHGKEWLQIENIGHNLALAIDASGEFPCQVMLIQVPVKALFEVSPPDQT